MKTEIKTLIVRSVICISLITLFCLWPFFNVKVPVSVRIPHSPDQEPVVRQALVHTVMPGETLFRLSKMYDVKADDIRVRNQLTTVNVLKMGQKITIPGAAPLNEVIPLFPSKKWKYIIIHHSATDEDDALSLYAMHLRRGWDSTGYDFLIDNGTKATVPGHVDATPRWIAQKDGAHCKAAGMNTKAIGVCLVGNFSKGELTEPQLKALVRLVSLLMDYYNIPVENIIGHGLVQGANTECPGKLFPWKKFRAMLAEEIAGDLNR